MCKTTHEEMRNSPYSQPHLATQAWSSQKSGYGTSFSCQHASQGKVKQHPTVVLHNLQSKEQTPVAKKKSMAPQGL